MTWIEDARAKEQAATPGEWGVDGPAHPGPDDTLTIYQHTGGAIAYVQPSWDDAEFIAWARNAVPLMLGVLEAADVVEADYLNDLADGAVHDPNMEELRYCLARVQDSGGRP